MNKILLTKLTGVLLISTILGCAGGKQPEFIRLQWPEAPLKPRIVYDTMWYSEDSIDSTKSFSESLTEFVTGQKNTEKFIGEPMDVAVSDDASKVYVSDIRRNLVFIFDLGQKNVLLLNQDNRLFQKPFGITVDKDDNLYVVDRDKRKIVILDRENNVKNVIVDENLERPIDVAVDEERGRIYVTDGSRQLSPNHYVKEYDMNGNFTRNIGDGKGTAEGSLMFPTFLTLDNDGNIYVSDTVNARISTFSPDGKFIKKFGERGNRNGMFDKPKGVALDSFGNLYVTDTGWNNIQIFNDKAQVLLFFGGTGRYPGLLQNPTGIAIDKNNRIYVADFLNHRVAIYKLVNTSADDSYKQDKPEEDVKEKSLN